MNFNEELQKLREVEKQCLSEAQSIESQRSDDLEQIEKIKKNIVSKYDKLSEAKYQKFLENSNKIDEYCKLIESYSYFNVKVIGSVIASLMTTFEGANYIYQEAEYYATEIDSLAFSKLKTKVTNHQRIIAKFTKHPRIIIAEENKCNWYSDDRNTGLNSIVKNGKAIILVDDANKINGPFYIANAGAHTLEQRFEVGRFSYVKDFIDELISYKIEHILKDIPSNEIERIKIDFISTRVEQIEKNYRLLALQQEEQMKQDKDNHQLQLKKLLDKKQQ